MSKLAMSSRILAGRILRLLPARRQNQRKIFGLDLLGIDADARPRRRQKNIQPNIAEHF